MAGSGCRPDGGVGKQVWIDKGPRWVVVPKWGHTTYREPGRFSHAIWIGADATLTPGGGGQLGLIELIASTDVSDHDLVVDKKDQALDDLTDLYSDGSRGVDGGLGAFWK